MSFPADDSVIRWRLHLRSAPEEVFRLLSTDDGRARFWAESAIETDGAVHFRFVNGLSHRSPILEVDPPRRFSLQYFGSTVLFELEPDGEGGTDLTLTDRGFDPADREELRAGWLNVLLPLKAAADFSIDLRNHDPSRTWQDGYVDQ